MGPRDAAPVPLVRLSPLTNTLTAPRPAAPPRRCPPLPPPPQRTPSAPSPPGHRYAVLALTTVLFLVFHVAPKHGTSSLLVPIAICSIMGSLSARDGPFAAPKHSTHTPTQSLFRQRHSLREKIRRKHALASLGPVVVGNDTPQVMSCKAVGSALRLTFAGENQFAFPETWYCLGCVAGSVVTQMNFLNRALDIFPAALVTPIYYVMFTTLTILASVVLFKEYESVAPAELATELCGFLTILAGVFVLHATKDADPAALWKRREGDAAGGVQMAGGVAQSPGAAAGGGRGCARAERPRRSAPLFLSPLATGAAD